LPRVTEQALNADHDRLHIPELARRARLRRVLLFSLSLIAAGAAYLYYARPAPPTELYRVEAVERRTLIQQIESTGSLDVRSRVEVPAPAPGRLAAIHVEQGQQVEQGAPLATLDPRAAELALRGARAGAEAAQGHVAEADVALASAVQAARRAQSLHDKGLASPTELEDANAARERAQAALIAARAERKLAGEQVATAELSKHLGQIVAPSAGVVLRAPDRVGAAVSPDQGPLFVIGQSLDVMRIDALVAETEIALVKPGMNAEVVVQALPAKTWTARVLRIGIEPKREGGVVHYPVTLQVDNPDGALLPGMSARVQMEVARAENALAVHGAALRFTPESAELAAPRSRVFVRAFGAGNELREVKVSAGISDGVYTEVTPAAGARLSAGDDVVIGLLRPEQRAKKPNVSLGGK
jgi:HlyD family secretion protein